MNTTKYTYEITPRPQNLGGGWRLRLLENGEEVGGGVYPLGEDYETEEAARLAAEDEAGFWLSTR